MERDLGFVQGDSLPFYRGNSPSNHHFRRILFTFFPKHRKLKLISDPGGGVFSPRTLGRGSKLTNIRMFLCMQIQEMDLVFCMPNVCFRSHGVHHKHRKVTWEKSTLKIDRYCFLGDAGFLLFFRVVSSHVLANPVPVFHPENLKPVGVVIGWGLGMKSLDVRVWIRRTTPVFGNG